MPKRVVKIYDELIYSSAPGLCVIDYLDNCGYVFCPGDYPDIEKEAKVKADELRALGHRTTIMVFNFLEGYGGRARLAK